MVNSYFNQNKSVALQYYDLNKKYKCQSCSLLCGRLVWIQRVKPTSTSKEYELTLKYDGRIPEVYICDQGIMKKENEYIPHCYERIYKTEGNEYVKLCLYYPKYKEWSKDLFLSETIIPWAIEWLKYYELWRITGKWLGGGIEHEKSNVSS